jgi:hypothetical protein
MVQPDMFGLKEIKDENELLKIIPVSVIDIKAQKKRKNENHGSTSSRANYSPFPSEISDLCYEFYLRDCFNIVDPFAGWGERHSKAIEYNKEYFGYDTSQVAIDKARDEYGIKNILANSLNVDIPELEGLLTCPPYWNLEKYADNEGIDRNKTWESFIRDLAFIFNRFYDKAEDNAIFCIMVGDWRKNHIYYDLDYEICKMFKLFGAKIVDKVVVSRKKTSKIKIMLPQAKRLGYSVRVHENLLVFKK